MTQAHKQNLYKHASNKLNVRRFRMFLSHLLMFSTSCVEIADVFCICLGLCAEEIHVCGEPAAIDFIRELMYTTGEEMEVRRQYVGQQEEESQLCYSWFLLIIVFGWTLSRSLLSVPLHSSLSLQVNTYKRLTPFTILDQALESLDNLRPGDCIVCFSKNDIYSLSRQIEARGLQCAVIYGSLPPGEFLKGC